MLLAKAAVETSDDIYAYKPFVDGLRAIAILSVVGGHLELSGMWGGFVGVDVFFVISGYLIINQIAADIRNGRFGLWDFWARRALRILPAFLLVVSACLALGGVVLVQYEYRAFADSFFFSTLMQANHYFLVKQNYFENIAYAKPLLHMWSLSVEEQFYLVAPLALIGMAAWTRGRPSAAAARIWIAVTAGLLVVSFALCVALTTERHNIAFYIMPARGWEFLLGGIVPWCVSTVRRWPGGANTALALAGATAIAAAVGGFGFETTYPSYRAALPALGAMLIIVSGLADPRNVVARTLATAPFVAIGLVSYSWYLWHWPLLSFLRLFVSGARDLALELGAMALALVLAALTWRFVERPVREWRRGAAPRSFRVVVAGTTACIVIGSAGALWSKYAMPDLTPSLAGFESALAPVAAYPPVVRRGNLVGDSQADTLSENLIEHARRAGASLRLTKDGGCPPILRVTILYKQKPREICDELYRHLALTGSDFLILAAVWDLYVTPPPPDRDFVPFWLADPRTGGPAADPYALLASGLAAMIAEAKRAGVKRILVIGAFPRFPTRPPNCVLRVIRLGVDRCSPSRASVDAHLAGTRETLRRVTAGIDGVRLIDPIDVFCTPSVCRPYADHTVYFTDIVHVSPAGAERFYDAFRDDIEWALTGQDGRKD